MDQRGRISGAGHANLRHVRQPPPHLLRICRAQFCDSRGSADLIRHVESRLGIKLGETTPDGRIALRQVYCLGMCGQSPAVWLDGKLYGKVTLDVADSLLDEMPGSVE